MESVLTLPNERWRVTGVGGIVQIDGIENIEK